MKTTKLLSTVLLLYGSFFINPAQAIQRVYLMAGQSNMSGTASTRHLPAAYRHTPNNVIFYHKGKRRPLGRYGRFGPEVSFAHHVSRRFPNDQHIIIKYAAGGSDIQQWMPGNQYYRNMLREVRFSLKRRSSRVDAIFWMQGESDAMNKFRAAHYGNRLSQFIRSLRRDLRSPSSMFVFGQVNPKGNGYPMVSQIQKKQQLVNSQVSNTRLVSSHGLGKSYDNVHYSAHGQVELGRRFAKAYAAGQPSLSRSLRSAIMLLLKKYP